MRALVSIAALGLLVLPVAAYAQAPAQPLPEWAYPVAPAPKPPDATKPIALPGSTKQYTQAQIDNRFGPPDWYPEDHPPMPEVVATGRQPNGFACALCHLTSGGGHPEFGRHFRSAGRVLPAPDGGVQGRHPQGHARRHHDPDRQGEFRAEDTKAAAEYFGGMKHPVWYKVVESDTVPKSYLGNGAMRFPVENGGTEPLGNRIIELPQNDLSAESRDPRTGFVAHVPVGSLKKGEELVTTGGGKTTACAVCHGPELKGLGQVPAITGRSPMYIYRQLNDIKIGTRNGEWTPLMKGVVDKLSDEDMIAISAYLTSKPPY